CGRRYLHWGGLFDYW
nr:immunoglobulin heavy chain junction region [Macaca mulatta]